MIDVIGENQFFHPVLTMRTQIIRFRDSFDEYGQFEG